MAAGQQNPLEPKYEEGRSYLVAGLLLNAIIRTLRLDRVIPGPGLTEKGTPMGRLLQGKGGAGGVDSLGPLVPTMERPPTFGAPGSGPGAGQVRVWFTWGTWNGRLPSNEHWYVDVSDSADHYFFAEATSAEGNERLEIESWEIKAGAAIDTYESSEWGEDGSLPEKIVVLLGYFSEGTGAVAASSRGGSLFSRDFLNNVNFASGATAFTRSIETIRH